MMTIAILGVGAIGSTFAFHLAQAGHTVTVVARGKRLAQLQHDQAIISVTGQRAPVSVATTLDLTTPWDLVLVTVLVGQVDVLLPTLAGSNAKTIMFMFNTVASLDRLRDAVGQERFAFGFPSILASLEDGKLRATIVTRGQRTPVTDARWATVFTKAGIPATVEPAMESWLRTHAALVVPIMVISVQAHARQAGVSWSQARRAAEAMREGFGMVRQLGNTLTPAPIALLSRVPAPIITLLLWVLSRFTFMRTMGAAGPREPQMLIDAMRAVAPGQTPMLVHIRPESQSAA
ncbi:ketopantoate reductase family protein [Herpetosiphon geysericola]|nr:ketopantoate reductase family protein [Herpetosiphon geysericola]